jgi:PGF-pre-PGF domain-containing protein
MKLFSRIAVALLLVAALLVPSTTLATTALAAEIKILPLSPRTDYEWVDSGETFHTITVEGVQYEPGIVVGAYLPQHIEVGKTYPAYVYVSRDKQDVTVCDAALLAADDTGNWLGFNWCVGLSTEIGFPKLLSWYLHFGVGYSFLGSTHWDQEMWHIPIGEYSPLTLDVPAEPISYAKVSDIPYDEWDGPYIIKVGVGAEESVTVPIPPGIIFNATATVVYTSIPTAFEFENITVAEVTLNIADEHAIFATVNIQQLTEKPPAIVSDPPGIVYRYLDISTELEDEDIDSVDIQFEVEKSWIVEAGIDESAVTLYEYDPETGLWNLLLTAKVGQDDAYIYYSATSPRFSVFAIAGEPLASAPASAGTNWWAIGGGIGGLVALALLFYFIGVRARQPALR